MKRAVIIHGWGGNPNEGWYPLLKKELENRDIIVEVPEMPNTEAPDIKQWVKTLAKNVDPEADTYLIGHSIGCQTILRYLEKLTTPVNIKGVVFVAGWLVLSGLTTPEEEGIARPWLETPVDLPAAKGKAKKIVSLFSDDDPFVPEENWQQFEDLGTITVVPGREHITAPSDIDIVLDVVKKVL